MHNTLACKFATNLPNTDESDLRIINESTVIIPPQTPEACILLEVVDDLITEGVESFAVRATASNPLDVVSGGTNVSVSDNDGR